MKKILYIITFALSQTSCSTSNIIKTEPLMTNDITTINFLKGQPPKNDKDHSYHQALIRGYVILKNNCLFIAPKVDSKDNLKVLIWPWNYSLKSTNESIQIVNGEKNLVAKVGQYVTFGGRGGDYPKNNPCHQNNAQTSWVVSP